MTEKPNIEQIDLIEKGEQPTGLTPEVAKPEDVNSEVVSTSPIVKIDPRDLNMSEENKRNDSIQQEDPPKGIETSGGKWNRVIEEKESDVEIPL